MGSRRAFLAGAATAVASGLAGCLALGASPRGELARLADRSGTTVPDLDGATEDRTYGWTLGEATYELTVAVPDGLLAYARSRPRVRDRGAYVADPFHDELFSDVADAIARRADAWPTGVHGAAGGSDGAGDPDRTLSAFDLARTFVQQLPYETDRESTGTASYPRYPAETLAAGRADCEDAAVLLSGVLERLGHDTALLAFWEANHMALGVAVDAPGETPGARPADATDGRAVDGPTFPHGGTRYAYLETAVPGWDVGEVPDLVGKELPEVMAVHGHPTLVADWETERTGGGLRARVSVRNVGDAAAEAVRVGLSLESSDGDVVGHGRSGTQPIGPAGVATFSVASRPRGGRPVRARIEVVDGGEVVDDVHVAPSDREWGRRRTGTPGIGDADLR